MFLFVRDDLRGDDFEVHHGVDLGCKSVDATIRLVEWG